MVRPFWATCLPTLSLVSRGLSFSTYKMRKWATCCLPCKILMEIKGNRGREIKVGKQEALLAGPCKPLDWREDRRTRPEWVLEPQSWRKGLVDYRDRGSASSCFRGIRELMPMMDSAPLPGRVGTWGPVTQWTHPPLYVHTRRLLDGMTLLLHSPCLTSLGHSTSISEYT